MEPYGVIAYILWNEYGYDLPDTPGNTATKVLKALDEAGYAIVRADEIGGSNGKASR